MKSAHEGVKSMREVVPAGRAANFASRVKICEKIERLLSIASVKHHFYTLAADKISSLNALTPELMKGGSSFFPFLSFLLFLGGEGENPYTWDGRRD